MMRGRCPHCSKEVEFKSTGTCPNCLRRSPQMANGNVPRAPESGDSGSGHVRDAFPLAVWLGLAIPLIGTVLSLFSLARFFSEPGMVLFVVAITLIVWTCVLFGAATGNRLVWRYLRVLSGLAIVINVTASLGVLLICSYVTWPTYLTAASPELLLMQFGFGTAQAAFVFCCFGCNSVRRYFGLICPECFGRTVGAEDFFFIARRCKACGTVW